MRNYEQVQLVAYGTVTSEPLRVLPPDPPASTDYEGDILKRATTLRDVATYIRTNSQQQLGGPDVLKVLVVPEFYFRFGGPMGAGLPPDDIKNSYPDAVLLITKMIDNILMPEFGGPDWNDWLIVAGSVFWHSMQKQPPAMQAEPTFLNTVIVINGGELPEEPPTRGEVPTLRHFTTNQKALMSNIDWTRGGYRPRDWDAALNPMFQPILSDDMYLRWHRFKVGGKYNSRNNEPIVLGVEVCLEHKAAGWGKLPSVGVLRYLTDLHGPCPDVQVITSCGMDINPSIGVATDKDGIVMLVDGMQKGPGARWPTAKVASTLEVRPGGERILSEADAPQSFALPDNLQVGYPYNTANPPDSVSIWRPVDLPNSPVVAS